MLILRCRWQNLKTKTGGKEKMLVYVWLPRSCICTGILMKGLFNSFVEKAPTPSLETFKPHTQTRRKSDLNLLDRDHLDTQALTNRQIISWGKEQGRAAAPSGGESRRVAHWRMATQRRLWRQGTHHGIFSGGSPCSVHHLATSGVVTGLDSGSGVGLAASVG